MGHCPLCHEYVSFEQCRPLTVIRCRDYKEDDLMDMVLIERTKGEQPVFCSHSNHGLNISTFRKFETERTELAKCRREMSDIAKCIKSSDPIYEEPFLRLLAIHVDEYRQYILDQRQRLNLNVNMDINVDTNTDIKVNDNDFEYDLKSPMMPMMAMDPQRAQQQQLQYEYQHEEALHRYRKKKFVYQCSDGQLLFLHPMNYNMLKHDNSGRFPSMLSQCKVLEIEHYEQSYDLRRKYPFLGFIPVDIAFSLIELDLSEMVSPSTIRYFKKQSFERQRLRVEKEKRLKLEAEREKIMEEQRIAVQKQKYQRPQIDINDYTEFPSLVTEEDSDHQQPQQPQPPQHQRSWSQPSKENQKKKRRRGRNKRRKRSKESKNQ